jgi:serine protease AprX
MRTAVSFFSALSALTVAGAAAVVQSRPAEPPSLYIVQAKTTDVALRHITEVGGESGQVLNIIRSVTAYLKPEQVARLRADTDVRVFTDRSVSTSGLLTTLVKSTTNTTNTTLASSSLGSVVTAVAAPTINTVTTIPLVSTVTSPLVTSTSQSTTLQDGTGVSTSTLLYETNYPALIGASTLQQAGTTGKGVTIAVLDTGLWQDTTQMYGSRILASIDVVNGASSPVSSDPHGHGTHIASIAAGGAQALSGAYLSVAPKANLVIVRAFDGQGRGRYTDVIAGLNWIVANKVRYNIRVLNLSFGAPPQSYYWDDPLNQAVMAAWRAGIVVVAASGNEGPDPMTIGVPGNVPYVITVGALTDHSTPYDGSDDRLASFSSTGPTFEGFVKPELVSPGGHIVASMSSSSYLANIDPDSMRIGEQMFTMSGTSQAAAVTSGVVALMLQRDATLTPDAVKCKLLSSSRPALKTNGALAYSVFQQGAGLINAVSAVNSTATGCANTGLDIDADLAGTAHYGGPANQDANGNYYVMDMESSVWGDPLSSDGYNWSTGYPWGQGYTWSEGYAWRKGYGWSKGYTWSEGYAWRKGDTWSSGYGWSKDMPWWSTAPTSAPTTSPTSIASWVPNE